MYICNVKEGSAMQSTNATAFRKDLFRLLEQTVKYNEPISVTTKDGNAVIISEEDYNGLLETLYLSSMPKLKKDIVEGMNTAVAELISEDEVEW
jgi:PHD/YefM family antitoxin component YafN of YafNO toxin-antitoxin module